MRPVVSKRKSNKEKETILSIREIMPRFCLRKYFDSDSFELTFIDRHRVGLVIDSIEALSSNKYELNIYLISKESPCQSTTQLKSNDGTIMQHNQKLTEYSMLSGIFSLMSLKTKLLANLSFDLKKTRIFLSFSSSALFSVLFISNISSGIT